MTPDPDPSATPPAPARLIPILGMHRSGTSAFAGVLHTVGFNLGPSEQFLGPLPENPKGFFESRQVVSINKRLLEILGGAWDRPPRLSGEWWRDDRLQGLRSEASQWLQESGSGQGPLFIKDPRLSFTWPFWHDIVPFSGAIICLRKPGEVIRSIETRNGTPRHHAEALWAAYTVSSLTVPVPQTIVDFADLAEAPVETVLRVIRDLGVDEPEGDWRSLAADFVDPSLRHHQGLVGEPTPLDEFYDLLRSGSFQATDDLQSLFRWQADSLLSVVRSFAVNQATKTTIEALEAEVAALSGSLAASEAGRAEERAADAERETRASAELSGMRTALATARQEVRAARAATRKHALAAERAGAEAAGHAATVDRILGRRSVRSALALARLAKPLFRVWRGIRLRLRKDSETIARVKPHAELGKDRRARRQLRRVYRRSATAGATLVSVIMPTYNRADTLVRAVASVQRQSHPTWELVIVDDGSTDATTEALDPFLADPRIRLVHQANSGASAARNRGLEVAEGSVIAYLDSDNTWDSEYLALSVAGLESTGSDCCYSGLRAVDRTGRPIYYRGAEFDWDECRKANYVDMNVFTHTAQALDGVGGFETRLRRMVDWDFILRLTHGRQVDYLPFIGCDYLVDQGDQGRISNSEPKAFGSVVRDRFSEGWPKSWEEVEDSLSLSIGIKISAPRANREAWGDFHYANALASSFRSLGHHARVDFVDEWGQAPATDVNLELRGLTSFAPQPDAINLIWLISHPDKVDISQLEGYSACYAASDSHAALVSKVLGELPVRTLPQATDPSRFHPQAAGSVVRGSLPALFVGNSRDHFRDIVRWTQESGVAVDVFGQGWDQFIPPDLVRGDHVPNEELGAAYAGARFVLNDHWESMNDFGIVSNRILDATSAGAQVISDPNEGITRLFGDAVIQVSSATQLKAALAQPLPTEAERDDLAEWVATQHGFDARARVIMDDVFELLGLARVHRTPSLREGQPARLVPRRGSPSPLKVAAIVPHGGHGPQSSAYIRLIAPLTSEPSFSQVDLSLVAPDESFDADILVVQRTSMVDRASAERLVRSCRASHTRLVVDNDDAFNLIDPSHPEYELLSGLNSTLEFLMGEADETWFSTSTLRDSYQHATASGRVIRNCLDPRFWKRYLRTVESWAPERDGCPRILYMGTNTHDADLDLVFTALRELSPVVDFRFTLIGGTSLPPSDDFVDLIDVPMSARRYPSFARWLLTQGPFDIGLAPLIDTPFNQCKSDIKVLDYAAIGIPTLASPVGEYVAAAEASDVVRIVETGGWSAALAEAVEAVWAQPTDHAEQASWLWSERGSEKSAAAMLDSFNTLLA